MNILKRLDNWMKKSNEKILANIKEKNKNSPLPVKMNLIETRSGCEIEFADEQSKINFWENFRRAELKARNPQNIDESLNS